jgi:hypothetical protein
MMIPGETGMDVSNLWAVEFDPDDRSVTIEVVESVLRENRKRIYTGEHPEKILLGIYVTAEEAIAARRRIRSLVEATNEVMV